MRRCSTNHFTIKRRCSCKASKSSVSGTSNLSWLKVWCDERYVREERNRLMRSESKFWMGTLRSTSTWHKETPWFPKMTPIIHGLRDLGYPTLKKSHSTWCACKRHAKLLHSSSRAGSCCADSASSSNHRSNHGRTWVRTTAGKDGEKMMRSLRSSSSDQLAKVFCTSSRHIWRHFWGSSVKIVKENHSVCQGASPSKVLRRSTRPRRSSSSTWGVVVRRGHARATRPSAWSISSAAADSTRTAKRTEKRMAGTVSEVTEVAKLKVSAISFPTAVRIWAGPWESSVKIWLNGEATKCSSSAMAGTYSGIFCISSGYSSFPGSSIVACKIFCRVPCRRQLLRSWVVKKLKSKGWRK